MVDAVVLDVQIVQTELAAQPFGAHKRRKAAVTPHRRLAIDRQQLLIPPHAAWTGLDRSAGYTPLDRVEIVYDLQRAEAKLADVDRRDGILLAAFAAPQSPYIRH